MMIILYFILILVAFVLVGFLGQWVSFNLIPTIKDKLAERKRKKLAKKAQKTLDKKRKM